MIGKVIGITLVILTSLTAFGIYFHFIKVIGDKLVISLPSKVSTYMTIVNNLTEVKYSHFLEKSSTLLLYSNSSNFTYVYKVNPLSGAYNIEIRSYSQEPFSIKIINISDGKVIYNKMGVKLSDFRAYNISSPLKIEIFNISSELDLNVTMYSFSATS